MEKPNYKFDTGQQIPGNTVEDKEAVILKTLTTIVIENYKLTKDDDCVEDFIHNFLLVYNRENKTYWSDSKPEEPVYTVHKADTYRSLLEIFLVTKYYFPQVTLRETIKCLYKLNEGGKDDLGHQICWTRRRRVYRHKELNRDWRNYDETMQDELGFTVADLLRISKDLDKVENKLEEEKKKEEVHQIVLC